MSAGHRSLSVVALLALTTNWLAWCESRGQDRELLPASPSRVRTDLYGDALPPHAIARMGTVRFRHGADITSLAFSPDGKLLASASHDHTVRLWDTATGKEVRRLEGHRDWVLAVAFAPNGRFLASASEDCTVRLWDANTGKEFHRLMQRRGQHSRSVAFTPDNKNVVAGAGARVIAWDALTGQELRMLEGPKSTIHALAFTPDGKILLAASADKTVSTWEFATGRLLLRMKGHEDTVRSLALSPGKMVLASGSDDHTIRLSDPATGELLRLLKGPKSRVSSVIFSPDGKALASAHEDHVIRFWDLATAKIVREIGSPRTDQPHPGGEAECLFALAFSPDGKSLAAAGAGRRVILYDLASQKELLTPPGHRGLIPALIFSGDGKLLASGGQDATVRVWETSTGRELRQLKGHADTIFQLALMPGDRTLVSGGADGRVFLWDWERGKGKLWPGGDPGVIHNCIGFSPDGRFLISVTEDHLLVPWDIAAVRKLGPLKHTARITAFQFAPDNRTLVTATEFGHVLCWDVPQRREIWKATYSPDKGSIKRISSHGQSLASVDGEDHVCLWKGRPFRGPRQLAKLADRFATLWFSPDGRNLATGAPDGTVRIWEVATEQKRLEFGGHLGQPWRVTFAPDGRTLATCGHDTILVWDIMGLTGGGLGVRTNPTEKELESLWNDLASSDARLAYRAVLTLSSMPRQSVTFLASRLRPFVLPESLHITELIAKLDSGEFADRQKAGHELELLGDLAEAALRMTLRGQLSPETRRQVERLLAKLAGPVTLPEELRALRSIEVLERVGTSESRQVLERLARGGAGGRRTLESQASLERLVLRASLSR